MDEESGPRILWVSRFCVDLPFPEKIYPESAFINRTHFPVNEQENDKM